MRRLLRCGRRAVIRPRRGVTLWARGTYPLPALRRLRYPGRLLARDTARDRADHPPNKRPQRSPDHAARDFSGNDPERATGERCRVVVLYLGVSIASPSGDVILVALRLRALHLPTIQFHRYGLAQVPIGHREDTANRVSARLVK